MTATAERVIGTDASDRRIEYRIDWYAPGFYRIDARVLQAGDVAYPDGRWYPIEDAHLVTLSRARGEASTIYNVVRSRTYVPPDRRRERHAACEEN